MKAIATNPLFIDPMKALPVDQLPEGDWLYEIKHDGYRALAFKNGKDVRLVSRNNKRLDYPQLLEELKQLPGRSRYPGRRNRRARREWTLVVSVPPNIQKPW
jgi:bifunctional non-homologous end joining protein LigD